MNFFVKPVPSCTTPAGSVGASCEGQRPAPVPMFRTFCDVPNSRRRLNSWPRPSLNWLKRQRWLLQQPSSGLWVANLIPSQDGQGWVADWTDRKLFALQFATEHLAKQVFEVAIERLAADLELKTVTFVAPPSAPSAWRPLDE